MPKPPMFYIDPHNPARICRVGEPSMTFSNSPAELIEHRLNLLNQGVLYEGEWNRNRLLVEALEVANEAMKVDDWEAAREVITMALNEAKGAKDESKRSRVLGLHVG